MATEMTVSRLAPVDIDRLAETVRERLECAVEGRPVQFDYKDLGGVLVALEDLKAQFVA